MAARRRTAARGGGDAAMLGLFQSTVCVCDVALQTEPSRKTAPLGQSRRGFVYTDGEAVNGSASISTKPGAKLEHQGILVEVLGRIDPAHDKAESLEFLHEVISLESPGVLTDSKQFSWFFDTLEKKYDTYWGTNVQVRYFVRLVVLQTNSTYNFVKELDFCVQNVNPQPEINGTMKMEMGIEDCLKLDVEFNKSKYHLKDVVVGKVCFSVVRVKLRYVELNVIRRESVHGEKPVVENETLTKFQIMDGAPVRNHRVPVRVYLAGTGLSPSFRNVHGKFTVKYFLSVVLMDTEGRRYFKQIEVGFFRNCIG